MAEARAVTPIWHRELQRNDKGAIIGSIRNMFTILTKDARWDGVLAFNEFSRQVVKLKPPPFEHSGAGQVVDVDDTLLQMWFAGEFGFNARIEDLRRAVYAASIVRRFHPVREYLDSLKWDGTERLEEWLITYFGAEHSEYSMLAGMKWMIGAVARVYRAGVKGVKMDNVLIFEGLQGRGKSSALGILGGDWFMDTPFTIGDKDAFLVIGGMWIVELAELDGFSRAESSKAKAFFSSSADRYRSPYGRTPESVPRQCVFAGTVNHGTYLRDTTGNRRYWPIAIARADLEALARDRDQLWAEAVHLFRDGIRWWVNESEQEIFAIEQEVREVGDALRDKLAAHLMGLTEITMAEALEALGLAVKDWTHAMQTRVGEILISLNFKPTRRKSPKEDSRRPRVYVRQQGSE